ncbi:unnamed protein product [Rotaria socialis]
MDIIPIANSHLSDNNSHSDNNLSTNGHSFNDTSNLSYDQRQSQANKKLKWYQHQTSIRMCSALWFTIILATIGIIITCLAQPDNTHLICDRTFVPNIKRVFTYDSRPRYVAVADFNNDNHLDLAVVNSIAGNIAILLGDGNGTFSRQYTNWISDQSAPYWIGVGDFNNDTLLDIAVANYGSHNIDILQGYGNGTFSIEFTVELGPSRPILLAVGDFNQDNILDIAVASNGTLNLSILIGSGDFFFAIQRNYYLGYDSMPYSIDVADLNYDNQADIMIVDYGTSNLIILLATGDGEFSIQRYSTGENSYPCSVALGDFDSDDFIDAAVVYTTIDNICIFQGSKNGTFQATKQFLFGSSFSRKFIVAGSLNTDGKLDLIVVDSGTSSAIVYEGSGDGTFVAKANHSTGANSNPYSIAVGDFNHDNKSDVVVANHDINSILVLSSYTISLIANITSLTPDPEFQPISMVIYDINNDQNPDIVVADESLNSVFSFLDQSSGTFNIQVALSTRGQESGPYLIVVGDFNNDMYADIVINLFNTNVLLLYLGRKNDSFVKQYVVTIADNWILHSMIDGDFNGDGNLDVVVANEDDGYLAILLGNGNGTFAGPFYSAPIFSYQISIYAADFNADNVLDLAIANSDIYTLVISLGYGDGSFRDPTFLSPENYYSAGFAIGNFDKDTILDIVATIPDILAIGVFLGETNGTFGTMTIYFASTDSNPRYIALGDFNKDTKIDIAVLIPDIPSIVVFYGTGEGTFPKNSTLNLEDASDSNSMGTGDFNNDGQVDLVTGNPGSNDLSILLLQYKPDFINEITYSQGSGAHPSAVTVGDFNNDLQLDIVVTNSGNNEVRILMGYNGGSFMTTATYSTGENSHPQQVVVANFNKDNQLDIAVVNSWSNALKVFLISNNGTTANSTEYSTGSKSAPNSLAVGDFNKDGWTDIVVANTGSSNIGIFLGYDYPTFNSQIIRIKQRTSYPTYVVVGDFDRDSQWDIAVTCFKKNSVSVFLGLGNGTFESEISNLLPKSSYPTAMVVGDFNNDNQSDIVVVNSQGKTISALLGYGNGTFAKDISTSTGNSSPVFIAMGDFNKDNKLDIAVAFQKDDNVGVFMGYGNGSFSQQIVYKLSKGSSPVWLIVHDFNEDNVQDMAVANSGGNNIGIFLGYGDGTFRNASLYSTGNNSAPCSIAIGDFNGDNRMDIAVANVKGGNIVILFGYNNETFMLEVAYGIEPGTVLTSIVVDDVNDDTILDIIISAQGSGSNNIGVFYGLNNGTFLIPQSYSTGVTATALSIAIADFDNDGRKDFVTSNSNNNSISIMLRYKSEPFGTQSTIFTGDNSQPYSVVVSDFDNNGELDIAVANSQANNIGIFLGNGDGTFIDQYIIDSELISVPVFIAIGEFNNDEKVDMVIANANKNNICILKGYGNGNFTIVQCYSTGLGSEPSSVSVGDFNKNNQTDLVVTNKGINTVLVFYGIGNGTFAKSNSYSLGYNSRPVSAAIGDFDNDGWLDIVVTNDDWGYVDVLLQTC